MNKKSKTTTFIITIVFALVLFYIGINPEGKSNPREAYLVYLDGNKIGMIEEKEDLLNKINNEQEEIKRKYKVDQVYPPTGLAIVKYITYDSNYSKIDEIYSKIDDFSIKGYTITIDSPDEEIQDQYLYILNKDYFDESMQKLISVFIPKETYDNYINETQSKISDTGEYVENIYLNEKITIKEGYISTKSTILTNSQEISKYLLYKTSSETKKYIVQKGDTIESIAESNNLNVNELLIANPDLRESGALLSSKGDQTINVSLINPIVNVVSETELIEKQVAYFETVVKYDDKLSYGSSYIEQKGENGVAKVKYKVKYINGVIVDALKISAAELTPSVNKIVIKGGYKVVSSGIGDPDDWGRPTVNYCKISSRHGYRGGEYHDAIDITGCGGEGSPIFAANDGVVFASGRIPGLYNPGIHVRIDHQNGYYTSYLHLSESFVNVGQTVSKGDRIGSMGRTGRASGVHLHFSIYYFPGGAGFSNNVSFSLNPENVSPAFRY